MQTCARADSPVVRCFQSSDFIIELMIGQMIFVTLAVPSASEQRSIDISPHSKFEPSKISSDSARLNLTTRNNNNHASQHGASDTERTRA
jgi:hypothetical protein